MIIIPNIAGGIREPAGVVATITVGTSPAANYNTVVAKGNYVYVANTGSSTISVIEAASNSVVSTISVAVNSLSLNPANQTLYGTYSAGNLFTIDSITSVTQRASNVYGYLMPISPDGTTGIALSFDTYYWRQVTLSNYAVSMQAGNTRYSVTNGIFSLTTAKNRFYKAARTSGFTNPGIWIHDIAQNEIGFYYNANVGQPGPMCMSFDESKMYFGASTNALYGLSTTTNTVASTKELGAQPISIARSLPGVEWNRLYVGCADNTVKVLDSATESVLASIPVGQVPRAMCVSPVNNYLYVANNTDGTVSVIG